MSYSIADIELEIEDRDLKHLPTEEIVIFLVAEALDSWKHELKQINELLWEEKLDDTMGDARKKENIEVTGDYITAVHLWARGGK